MGRRKRNDLDDGDDSDASLDSEALDIDFDNDPDAKAERELFQNPYKRKRSRKNGKEDAIYGIFGDSDEEDTRPARKRSDWTKAPAFVSGDKAPLANEPMKVDPENDDEGSNDGGSSSDDGGGSEGEDDVGDDGDRSDKSESSRAPSPRVREEEDVEPEVRSRFGGLGMGGIGSSSSSSNTFSAPSFSKGGIGSATQSTMFPRGGIGSRPATVEEEETPTPQTDSRSMSPSAMDSVPSAFGKHSSKFRFSGSAPAPVKKVALPAHEMAHFGKLQGSFGARMLEKMGWQTGTGLGASGEGIVIPIESKLRPQKMGIAFKGFKEKTEQSKLEARRRGEVVSDDEKDPAIRKMKKKAKEAQDKRADAWKRPKRVKTKVEHKTYEQIVAEAGETATSGIGMIIDATGAVPREVSSLADVSLNSWSPSNDPTRIPEVRHNIKLIADACKTDLEALAREAKSLAERKKFVNTEDARLRKKVEEEAELIARLQQVQIVANDISATAQEQASTYEVSLEPFAPHFQKLVLEYAREIDKYRLDEIVVAAIAPVVRRLVAQWDPLDDPSFFLDTFRSWRPALKITEAKEPETRIDFYGTKTVVPVTAPPAPMTPFESLLWNVWLPKVRASVNNEWSADHPQPMIKLYEAWSTFLPAFIRDNILDQLILPKVQKAVAEWNSKTATSSLRSIVFPWLPYVGLRLEDVVGDARRKIKSLLRSWTVDAPIPMDLIAWKDVFDASDWDNMLLKYVVPKLGATLRSDFRVNPRDQKLELLQRVLAWSPMLRPSVLSQLLETEFFPKWLDVLHVWLIQPKVSFEEVAQWYSFWKGTFPDEVRELPGVSRGFTRGLQLMNKAIELGPDAPSKLAKPDFLKEIASTSASAKGAKERVAKPSARSYEVTFRSIAEEFAASRNLLFIPSGRAHIHSRVPLYRVSQTADGKKGLLVYILDDAVWAPPEGGTETDEFVAIDLDTMALRAMTA